MLRSAGLVTSDKVGLYVTYRLASHAVEELVIALRAVAERHVAELADVKRELSLDAHDDTRTLRHAFGEEA